MSAAATKKARLEDELEWRTRIERKIDTLADKFADDGQLRANCSYIFRPEGPWEQYGKKVIQHDNDLLLAKGGIAVILTGLIGILLKPVLEFLKKL
jgi:hypothetical protein